MKKRELKPTNLVLEKYVSDKVLTPEIEQRYAKLYGRIVSRSAAIFGGFYLYCEIDKDAPVVVL